jgi:hypothetical protein
MPLDIEIRSLSSVDWDGATFTTSEPVLFAVYAELAKRGDEASSLFEVLVCNAAWIEAELVNKRPVWRRALMIMSSFDMTVLRHELYLKIAACGPCSSWAELVQKLAPFLMWEAEGLELEDLSRESLGFGSKRVPCYPR